MTEKQFAERLLFCYSNNTMNEENADSLPKIEGKKVKKFCFLCTLGRYLIFFVLGVFVGLIWGSW
jgi:hypothetical protein